MALAEQAQGPQGLAALARSRTASVPAAHELSALVLSGSEALAPALQERMSMAGLEPALHSEPAEATLSLTKVQHIAQSQEIALGLRTKEPSIQENVPVVDLESHVVHRF